MALPPQHENVGGDGVQFNPIRQKRKLNERRNDRVVSIYDKNFVGNTIPKHEVENLRWINGIEVKGKCNKIILTQSFIKNLV